MPSGSTRVMGILNVTPDSFSDAGRFLSAQAAVERARQMAAEGADIIDVGGESTRPGADEVDVDEETSRTAAVVEQVASLGLPVSIDTRKATVAKAALDAGASMINDVSAGIHDEQMLPLAADRDVPIVLMHMRGDPKTMDDRARYADVVAEVRAELRERVEAAERAGVDRSRVLLDPGLGFAKTPQQSLELIRRIADLQEEGFPLVIGPSRKRFIGHVLGGDASDRLEGTLAVCAFCALKGVDIVRVHDVKEVRRVVDMIRALRS